MSDSLRTFVAVPLPEGLHDAIAELQRELEQRARSARARVRWLPTADLHVTLKFLGRTAADQLPALERALKEQAGQTPPCRTEGARLTAFASLRRARVIVVELSEPAGALVGLAQRLDRACLELGFEPESRAFRPHATLGRMREPANVSAWLEERAIALEPAPLSEAVLFRSDLSPSGAVYTAIARGRFS